MRFLVIGSSVTDFFSEIASGDNASISDKTVTFHLGDKIPIQISKQVMGGNGMNVSIGLSRLQTPTSFYTYLGNDSYAYEIESFLKKEEVNVYAEKDSETSDLSFILDIKDDRIIFSHHPIRNHGFSSPSEEKFDVIFLSSIGESWENAYEKVINYAAYSQTPIAFSPGSRQLSNLNDIFFTALHASQYILVNKDEACDILEKFGSEHSDIQSILRGLHQLGPKIISITDGGKGAYAYDGENSYHIPSLPKEEHSEKTGAGDAYASGFLAALSHKQPVTEAMRWGSFNASMVMKEIGAQEGLLTKDALLQLLEKHGTFKATKLE
jgi:ribokinase